MKKKLGDWFIDISKYTVTAVIISAFFNGADNTTVYSVGMTIVISALAVGLWLYTDKARNRNTTHHNDQNN